MFEGSHYISILKPKVIELNPAVVAEWLKELFPNSSRESPESHEFKSPSELLYAFRVIVDMDCDMTLVEVSERLM